MKTETVNMSNSELITFWNGLQRVMSRGGNIQFSFAIARNVEHLRQHIRALAQVEPDDDAEQEERDEYERLLVEIGVFDIVTVPLSDCPDGLTPADMVPILPMVRKDG